MDAVVLKDLGKTFGKGAAAREAIRDVSLKIPAGGVTALIGPDGAGKTTLLRLLAGVLAPTRGELQVLGLSLPHDALAVQARAGYMPQRFGLYEDLTVQENFDLFASLRGVPYDQRSQRFDELLALTALGPFRRRRAGQLSGGMKQKLGLACARIQPLELLLLDEPSVGVDPVSRRELWSIIRRQVAGGHVTVLLSTAYMDEAERCDRVILLHEGRVLAHGTPGELRARFEGHSFVLHARQAGARSLQARVAQLPGVLDAAIQAEAVRIVMRQPQAPVIPAGLATGAAAKPVPPRLEDAFVSLLADSHAQPAPQREGGTNGVRAGDTVVEVHDLCRNFGDFAAVKRVTFSVRRGEIFGLLGANGAGKSTTFRMLCGLLPSSSGTLRVAGVDLRTARAAARARIGYVSQKFSMYGSLSVRQNLAFFASAYGLRGRDRVQRIEWALEELELREYLSVNAGTLPLGYKQRLALACALMHEPEILFLDEPTSGVDPLARREFWARVNALAEAGTTCLVTTHFMEEAEYCDRLVLMSLGEVLAEGTPAEVRRAARRPDLPEPTMEDAFIALIEEHERTMRRSA